MPTCSFCGELCIPQYVQVWVCIPKEFLDHKRSKRSVIAEWIVLKRSPVEAVPVCIYKPQVSCPDCANESNHGSLCMWLEKGHTLIVSNHMQNK